MSRYAAIDIGSNSVRMEVAEVTPPANGSTGGAMPAIRILASERQVTRLGASVFRTGSVSAEAMDFVSTALAGMAYTTRITFAGQRFPELYGNDFARNAYEHAWRDPNPDLSDDWTFAIRRYGMAAAPR